MLNQEQQLKLFEYWKNGSEEDFSTAQEICSQTNKRVAALFFLHLAIEKALKAEIVNLTKDHPPFTHNLLHLTQKLSWNPEESILTVLAEINDFNLESRYPDYKKTLYHKATKEFTDHYINKGKEIFTWISLKSKVK
jgi:HEPN domain-containing protein